jgi:ABC-2 type transport system ATP-binding protein
MMPAMGEPAGIDATTDGSAILVHGLTKQFGGRAAVEGLNLAVRQGEVFGFLGPNGAGKTTTIRLILGLLKADAGEAFLLGDRVPAPARLRDVGAMVEEPAFYPWLSGRQNLTVLLETGAPASPGAVDEALGATGLSDVAGRKVKTYSQGMRQRLGLAVALLRKPRLLILDEPANGLDPAGIREFRDRFRALGDAGVTVFISSHLLGEVERTCDRVAIVDHGRLVAVGRVDELVAGGGPGRIRVAIRDEDTAEAARLLERFDVRLDGPGALLVAAESGRDVNEALARGGVFAESIARDVTGLEERFLSLTEGNHHDRREEGVRDAAASS